MKQKLLALLLIALLMPLCTWASLNVDDTFTDNGIMYKVISTSPRKVQVGIGTTSATAIDVSTTGKLQIPSSVKGTDGNYYSVTSIGDYAFYYCNNLTSIVIPSSVISIGIGSFDNCKGLTDIVIGNSVETIGGDAFFACSSLTNINIPKSVKKIGYRAFQACI